MVHPYSIIVTTTAWKKSPLILTDWSHFHMIDSLSIAIHMFTRYILISLSVDETLLPRCVNLSTDFREQPFRVEMPHSRLKHVHPVLSVFTWRSMPSVACSRLCSRNSARVGVFARSAMLYAYSAFVIVIAVYCSLPF